SATTATAMSAPTTAAAAAATATGLTAATTRRRRCNRERLMKEATAMATAAHETAVRTIEQAAVVCERLSKQYGAKVAVDGIDWIVPKGSVTGLVGPNGAGKSTTLKMLIGLVHPTSGSARVLGLDVAKDDLAIRERTSYMAEEDALF